MKKSQSSLFFIFGLILIIVMGIYFSYITTNKTSIYYQENKKSIAFSDMRTDISNYINLCIKNSAKDATLDTGIREDTIETYKSLVKSKIEECSLPFFTELKKQNYIITEGDIIVDAQINSETIIVDITYSIIIEYEGQKIKFKEFNYVFDRTISVKIPGGITDKEISIISSNEKAKITIPAGIKITDKNGNPIENIGIKVDDLHFDGLENRYVLGQLVYNNLPDGLIFSEPVEFSIEFREEDIPAEYKKDNIRIAYWDNKTGIWYALNTKIENNRAIANITHFTHYSAVFITYYIIRNLLFQNRFSPYGASQEPGFNVWLIGGNEPEKGTATLQRDYYINSYASEEGRTNANFQYDEAGNVQEGLLHVKNLYPNEYEDFRNTIDTAKFISKPLVEYGYYPDPMNPTDESFINCEPTSEQETDNIKYFLKEDGYPYFQFCDVGCRNDLECSCDEDACSSCNGITTCFSNNAGNLCIPIIGSIETEKTIPVSTSPPYTATIKIKPCTEIKPEETLNNCIPNSDPIFGWHNYQCAGGRVRPTDTASDFLVFEPDGNGVFDLTLRVYEKPSTDWYEGYDFGTFARLLWYSEDPTSSTRGNLEPYYCTIENFPSGELIKTFSATENMKNNINRIYSTQYDIGDLMTAVGIYGLNIIKRTYPSETPKTKTELHTNCEVYWVLSGNGFYSNPDIRLSYAYTPYFDEGVMWLEDTLN